MAEIQDEKERKELYRLLLNDPATRNNTLKYSFKQWESKMLGDEENFARVADYAVKKSWALDKEDFLYKYAPEKAAPAPKVQAPPAPKPQAAPVAPPTVAAPIEQAATIPSVEPMEEKEDIREITLPEVTAYGSLPKPGTQLYEDIMRTNPLVGSDEYNLKIAVQNQIPTPELGAGGYGGALQAPFETKAQIEQEAQSPVFRRRKLAEEMFSGNIPAVTQEDVRKAQRGFGAATKEQQEAAIMGGTGAELKKIRQSEKEGKGERVASNIEAMYEGAKNAGINLFAGLRNQMNVAALNETPMDDEEREYYTQKEYEQMYNTSNEASKNLQRELYRLNVSADVLDAIDKGNYSKIPEATLQTIANVGVSAIASLFTAGGSMYFQTLPDTYREGVEAIAKEKGITPEEVIRSGEDAKITAQTTAGIISALERAGAGRLSKTIANKGGYKAIRDYLIRKGFGKTISRAGGLGYASLGESATEYAQQGAQQLGRIAAASDDASQFFKKIPKDFLSKAASKERLSAGVGGFVGAGGFSAIGRGLAKAFKKGPDITKFSPEVQENPIITLERDYRQERISRAEEQGKKPDKWDVKHLEKLRNNPEAWVKEEIEYFTQKIKEDKKANIDTKRAEADLAEHNALLAQIKAEKKAMEQADIASAEQPIAPQEEVETVSAEELQGPGYQIAYAKTREEIPQEYRGTIVEIERPTTRLGRFGPMERLFAYRVPTETIDITAPEITAPEAVTETAPIEELPPVTEEAPIEEAPATTGMFEGIEGPPMEEAAPVTPAEEEVVTEEVPAEPIAPATEEEKQKSLEDEIESIKAQINSLRSEDGSVPSGKRAEFDRLVNLLTQATANAKRGNSTSVTPIRVIPEDIATQAPAFITDANEKAEAADLIEQAIQSSKTWEEAMRKIRKLGYVFDANDNMLLANYLKDRFNPDAPRIGNNKDSFQAWVNGKTDADLAAPEVVSAAPVEEAAPEAPVKPVTETTQAISATRGDEAKKAMIKEIDSQVSAKENELIEKQKQAIEKAKNDLKAINNGDKSVIEDYVKKSGYKLITKEVIAENPKSELIKKSEGKYYNSTGASIQVKTAEQIAIDAASKKANSKPTGSKIGANQYVDAYNAIIKFSQDKITAEEAKDIIEKAGLQIPKAVEQSLKAPQAEAPAAPAPKGKVEVVFPKAFEATEVKPYAEVEDNYYRPDQQLKFNQGTYEPVRIIAHPDVIRAMSIGSKLRDNNKRKTVTEQEIDFANGIAKQLGFTTESGKGSAIMLHNAARELAKQNRSNTEERFVVIGEEQGGKKKAPAPKAETKQAAPVTPAPAAPKKEGAKESLGKRLKGDALLNAEDTLTELSDNGATINPDGTVVVYHRTTKDKADAIVKNNEMFGLEDGVFFSTSEKGQAEGYGDVVVKMNVPIEQIEIDDTFGNEAHVRIPTKKANQKISVSKFSPQITSAEVKPAETKEGKKVEAKEEKKETSFKGIASFETAKGSVYTVLPDGRTQRFKTATKEQNEPQDLTVFVKFKDAAQEQDFLEGVQRSETSGTKVYVIDKQGNKYDTNAQAAGKDVRLALVKDGKVIDTAETSTTPKIGYNTFDQRRFEKDGEKYRQAHLGNKVVKINEQTKTEAQAEAAPSFTSEQSSEAATAFDKAKTSKGFDKKYGKGAYKALSDITKNFEDIMDKVSEKIKQDCIV